MSQNPKNKLFSISFFITLLLILVSVFFAVHYVVLKNLISNYDQTYLVYAYLSNFILAIIIFVILFKLKKNHTHLIGFAYLGGSFLKFAVFFMFFYPVFKADGIMDTMESTTFLIPYFLCLFYETFYVVKMLNK